MSVKVFDYEKKFFVTEENALEVADKMGDFLKQRLKDSGMEGYVLGISGGLDSAVAAYLCNRAGINLYLIMMPYGDTMSKTGSQFRAQLCINDLGLEDKSITIDIKPACEMGIVTRMKYAELYPNVHPHAETNLRLASENRRARQRMMELYDFGQVHRLLVLGTDNLGEHCLGYFTKYGDGASDIEPLQYCLKSEVRTLAKALGVPNGIITCAPSAELYDGQTDETDLGFSYDDFDAFALNGTSGSAEIDEMIKRRYYGSQHKREFPPAFNS
jgi:NAD+ synthase